MTKDDGENLAGNGGATERGLDLPHPDSDELAELLKGLEPREAYRWLFENRTDPQPMSKWMEHSQRKFGKTNSNTGRRLRDVYAVFEVRCYRQRATNELVYGLVGRKPKVLDQNPLSNRLQEEVFTLKGRYCAMCGRGAVDGVKLEIDHITPPEWRGSTVLDNLEPLCAPHNHGKKAFSASLNEIGPLIRIAMAAEDPWRRIGELLKGLYEMGRQCPVELIALVAKEIHRKSTQVIARTAVRS